MTWGEIQRTSHRRFDALRREWVLVSPHRAHRPWQGRIESPARAELPQHDPSCYLCPGNRRAAGTINPVYTSTFVFDNDFPSLLAEAPPASLESNGIIAARTEGGLCRVVCFSPRHDKDLSRMSTVEVRAVVEILAEQYAQLSALPSVGHVQIFENRGESMGASSAHPHGQIWATASVPNEPARELESMRQFRAEHGACLLCRYCEWEVQQQERIVCENDGFVALVPFWAVWPFEVLVLSRRHLGSLDELSDAERSELSDLLRRLTTRYDNLFATPFPYSMGFHQRPTDGAANEEWHFHAHYYPPLLRSASVRKFMVGFEMMAMPQRDITPEEAAARLRATSERHYAECSG